MHSTNSFSSLFADIIRRDTNSVELLKSLSESVSADTDTILIKYTNEDGSVTTYSIPSYKFMVHEINRISKNFDNLSKSNNIIVKDSSGNNISFSRNGNQESKISISVPPSTFIAKDVLVEQMLSPTLNVKIPVDILSEKYSIKKFKLKISSDTQKAIFNSKYLNNIIDHDTIEDELARDSMEYEISEFETSPERRTPIKFGSFDVLSSRKDVISLSVNNQTISKDVVYYKLNTLYFNDSEGRFIQLKKDDEIITPGNYGKYIVTQVLTSTNEISVKRDQGFGTIQIGVGKLSISETFSSTCNVLVPVNVDEYVLYFIKPINTANNSTPGEWTSGFGIFTSNIVLEGTSTTLKQYYDSNVKNISRAIEYVTEDKLVPLIKAITPNSPALSSDDFKVIQLNTHKDDVTFLNSLKANIEKKDMLKKEIDLLDKSIATLKSSLSDKSTINSTLLKQTEVDINNKYAERNLKVDQYNSLVENLSSQTKDIAKYSPKYAIQGFIPIPEPVYEDTANLTGKQEVVQFLVNYRYLSKNNSVTSTSTFKKEVDGKTTTADFGPWVEFKTKSRSKNIDSGVINWKSERLDSSDVVNFNQISIPITSGENVEIRIKSLGEAGFPYSPVESEWSGSIIVEFPEELSQTNQDTIDGIGNELAVVQIKQALEAMGVSKHLTDNIFIYDKLFNHQASNILTSISDSNGRFYDADSFLRVLKDSTDKLYSILNRTKPKVSVFISDSNGKELNKVNNFDTVKLFAGFYIDGVAELTVPKGEIITKVFYVNITNDGDTDLELLPYQPGILNERLAGIQLGGLFPDDNSYYGYMYNKSEYDSYRKYHRVPMSLSSVLNDNDLYNHYISGDYPYINTPPYQSSQSKGQLVYARYMDVSLTNRLYERTNLDTLLELTPEEQLLLPTTTINGLPSTNMTSYVWDETMGVNSANGNGLLSDFCVHLDHPDLKPDSEFFADFAAASYSADRIPKLNIGGQNNNIKYIPFAHNYYFNIEANKNGGTKQLEYIPFEKTSGVPGFENFARKVGFATNDKYLIGQNTCGSYLFMAPPSYKFLYTGSAIYSQGFVIKKGDSIRIPIYFQYRMTDYDGAGSSGLGNIGGFGRLVKPTNLTYTKKMGLDFVVKDEGVFSFDIEVTAKYKPDSVSTVGVRG